MATQFRVGNQLESGVLPAATGALRSLGAHM